MIKRDKYFTFGMTALVLSNVLQLVARRVHGVGEAWFDGGIGFFTALAIGLLLLWVRSGGGARSPRC